jgi:hypothetical protein
MFTTDNDSSEFTSNECAFPDDFDAYQYFIKSWNDNTFSSSDPVYALARKKSFLLCNKYNCKDYSEDLTQIVLMQLSRGQYKGACPLEAYANVIAINQLRTFWRQTGSGKAAELSDDVPELEAVVDEIFKKLCSEQFMRRQLAGRSDLQRDVICTVINLYDGNRVSQEAVIKALLEKDYTRYEVIVAFKRLREQLSKFL